MSEIKWFLLLLAAGFLILLFRHIQLKKQIRNLSGQVKEWNRGNSGQMIDISMMDKDLEHLAAILNLYNIGQRQAVAKTLRHEEHLKESVANISVVLRKAEKMKELVEAFYDLSVLEEQQTVPSKETFNFSNMLIDLITEHAPALEKKNIIPEIKLPDYSIYIYSDRNMVERILQNLLTNAMKYSAGNIKITLMQKSDGGIRFMMENPVSDSLQIDGNRLFDRFYTGDTSRHDGSTGVGLAVVKALVLALDGNVGASVQDNNLKIILEL